MLDSGRGFADAASCDLAEALPAPWAAPSRRPCAAACSLAALRGTNFTSRFASWRGRSGRSYVFSVYSAADCPAFSEAVLIVAARRPDGGRRLAASFDTGAFPEPVLVRASAIASARAETLEFHLHLIARPLDERRAVLADLEQAGIEGPAGFASPDRPRPERRVLTLADCPRPRPDGRSPAPRSPGLAPRSRGGSPASG